MAPCRKCSQLTFVTQQDLSKQSGMAPCNVTSLRKQNSSEEAYEQLRDFSIPRSNYKLPVISLKVPFLYLSHWIFFLPFYIHLFYDFVFIFSTHSLLGNICLPYISIVNFTHSIYFQIRISRSFIIPFFSLHCNFLSVFIHNFLVVFSFPEFNCENDLTGTQKDTTQKGVIPVM